MMDMNMKKWLCEDRLYDQRSLVYENGVLQQVEDPHDTDQLQEGRMGEYSIKRIKLSMGLMLMLPMTKASRVLDGAQVLADTDAEFVLAAEGRFLSLKKDGAAPEEDPELVPWSGGKTGSGVTHWAGMVDSGMHGVMLGIVSRISGKDGCHYLLTYAGTGNFTDIRMEHTEVLNALRRRVSP